MKIWNMQMYAFFTDFFTVVVISFVALFWICTTVGLHVFVCSYLDFNSFSANVFVLNYGPKNPTYRIILLNFFKNHPVRKHFKLICSCYNYVLLVNFHQDLTMRLYQRWPASKYCLVLKISWGCHRDKIVSNPTLLNRVKGVMALMYGSFLPQSLLESWRQ